ncbi:MAG: hypothetical protein WBJ62_07965 [Coriobacteriia bacterium]
MLELTGYQSQLLSELSATGLRYLVIGGKAMQAHGLPRDSWDLDLWTSREEDDVASLFTILRGRCPDASDLSPAWLSSPGRLVPLADSSLEHQADVLTSVGDLVFDDSYAARVSVEHESLALSVADPATLIATKLVSLAANADPERKLIEEQDILALQVLASEQHASI